MGQPMAAEHVSLMVFVRVRPLLSSERTRGDTRDILRVLDERVVVVLDPDESKDYLDVVHQRSKERKYTFDVVFDHNTDNRVTYQYTVSPLISGVINGVNTTVFAYGATGSGKTHTMVGSPQDPGLMVRALEHIFKELQQHGSHDRCKVVCSYLEVYNENIYDLLLRHSTPLELREDPEMGVQVAGLKRVAVRTAEDIMNLLEEGNRRRKTESTDANTASSRSHAVLEIAITRTPQDHYRVKQLRGKLALVDLAGSERAAETNNMGHKLRDGANINRSLLALANCINALGKQSTARRVYVPYRNSKLTRLLKDGLSGNCKTCMVATVAAGSDQYHHTINTLKYADRAKEIKTHVIQNVGTVESHIQDYQRIIDNLQAEVQSLRGLLTEQSAAAVPHSLGGGGGSGGGGGEAGIEATALNWLNDLAEEINANVQERINLQKALFELEDMNVSNRYELNNIDALLAAGAARPDELRSARERKSNLSDAIRDNEEAGVRLKADIEANEDIRRRLQGRIAEHSSHQQNTSLLKILSTFRIQAVRLQELQFQMAVRDQIIQDQKEVIGNLWKILQGSGLTQEAIGSIAEEQGIHMEGGGGSSAEPEPAAARAWRLQADQRRRPSSGNGNGNGNGSGAGTHGSQRPRDAGLSWAAPDVPGADGRRALAGRHAEMRYNFWSKYDMSVLESRRPASSESNYEYQQRISRSRGYQRCSTNTDRGNAPPRNSSSQAPGSASAQGASSFMPSSVGLGPAAGGGGGSALRTNSFDSSHFPDLVVSLPQRGASLGHEVIPEESALTNHTRHPPPSERRTSRSKTDSARAKMPPDTPIETPTAKGAVGGKMPGGKLLQPRRSQQERPGISRVSSGGGGGKAAPPVEITGHSYGQEPPVGGRYSHLNDRLNRLKQRITRKSAGEVDSSPVAAGHLQKTPPFRSFAGAR